MRLIDADAIIDEYNKSDGTISDLMEIILSAAEAAQPPNPPLTLEELRGMDGKPVWVKFPKCPEANGWMLVSVSSHSVYDGLLGDCDFGNLGETWLAYRRKPEEGTK